MQQLINQGTGTQAQEKLATLGATVQGVNDSKASSNWLSSRIR